MIIPSRFAADSIEASFAYAVENVNLCALKIGLLQKEAVLCNELFKCRKKREQSFLEQKHSEKAKTKRIRLGRKRNGDDDAQSSTPQTVQTEHSPRDCVRMCNPLPCMCASNDDDRCCCSSDSHQSSADVINLAPLGLLLGANPGSQEDKVGCAPPGGKKIPDYSSLT